MIDLTRARANAERTLSDVATVTRASGTAPTYDPTALTLAPAAPTVIETGMPCSVHSTGETLAPRDGDDRMLTNYKIIAQQTASDIRPGDVITLTSVGPYGDSSLIGIPLTVSGIESGSHAVLRRLVATGVAHGAVGVVR